MYETKYLNKIESPAFVKNLNENEIKELCGEIRDTLIDTVSLNGGHLASNLGVVELTVALHKMFDSPTDKIIWDVGHQIYTHKLLTGRFLEFSTLRKEGGISGYSRPSESDHDVFYSGHSGTSVSSALGVAAANAISGSGGYAVSVIGDGSFTGGMVYEAMNNAGRAGSKLIVILNENEMSISGNVGSLARYLAVIRSKPEYYKMKEETQKALNRIPVIGKKTADHLFKIKKLAKETLYGSNLFEDLGFRYMGPVDGHDVKLLCEALDTAKMINIPVLLHVYTTKGKGYDPAEREPGKFHGVPRFDIQTGEQVSDGVSFSSTFGEYMCETARKDKTLCAITAAMSIGTGLQRFESEFGSRFFDVGIAEEHAVTFASGLSKQGFKPVVAIYSTFLQRAYDQILHDGALQKLKIVLAIDRAGFVGEDGETHQGIFDAAFLNSIPGVTIYSPSSYMELRSALTNAVFHDNGLAAVRYPRGEEYAFPNDFNFSYGDFDVYGDSEAPAAIITYGRISAFAARAVNRLKNRGINAKLVKLNKIKPIPEKAVSAVLGCEAVFFFEEGVKSAGIGEKTALMLLERGYGGRYELTAVDDCFVPQASVSSQLRKFRLDAGGMEAVVCRAFQENLRNRHERKNKA